MLVFNSFRYGQRRAVTVVFLDVLYLAVWCSYYSVFVVFLSPARKMLETYCYYRVFVVFLSPTR